MTEETLERSDAISQLVGLESERLSPEDAESLLLDFWGLDEQREGMSSLPRELRSQLLDLDSPPSFNRSLHSPLIELGLRAKYLGVRNEYLEKRLFYETGRSHSVFGPLEVMQGCPCCDYMCLRMRGDYEICQICFWQDDGSDLAGKHSPPNRMSLAEARRNFEVLGCIDERHLSHLGEDRMEWFPRAEQTNL